MFGKRIKVLCSHCEKYYMVLDKLSSRFCPVCKTCVTDDITGNLANDMKYKKMKQHPRTLSAAKKIVKDIKRITGEKIPVECMVRGDTNLSR